MKATNQAGIFDGWLSDIRITEVIVVTVVYIVCARVGQIFAIEPANVTPVWIPSGVMLALALRFGPSIWPGVFFGAFLGNIWAYFSLESGSAAMAAISSASLNGIGDVLCVVLSAQLILRQAQTPRVLSSNKALFYFIVYGVMAGPLISAIFGCGGLLLFGHIPSEAFTEVFITWFLGDSVGVLVFTPFLISWLYTEHRFDFQSLIALVFATGYSILLTAIAFGLTSFHETINYGVYLLVPLLFALLFRYGQRLVFTVQLAVLSTAILATWLSIGPFAGGSMLESLIKLQSFTAAFSLVLFTIAIFNLEKTINEAYLEKHAKELEELYRKDQLTGLWNRYRIKEFLKMEFQRLKRDQNPFAILMIDIDDFKHINDVEGHLTGDLVLTTIANLIQSNIREIDFAGRWGGEEFIVVINNATIAGIEVVTQKLIEAVRQYDFGLGKPVTISVGATLATTKDTELSMLDRADGALYKAKNRGKNQGYFDIID